jgi:hypothetical protein
MDERTRNFKAEYESIGQREIRGVRGWGGVGWGRDRRSRREPRDESIVLGRGASVRNDGMFIGRNELPSVAGDDCGTDFGNG